MLKVGEFARLAQVSVRLLRYYDEFGLLSPACVDRSSGYRYYSVDQLSRLYRILALKDLGLSLEQVARLVNEELSPEEMRGMLLLKQAELSQHVSEEQARLDRVQQRLRFIEQMGAQTNDLPELDVIIKPVPALHVLSLRRAVKPRQQPHYVFYAAGAALRQHGLYEAVESVMCRYHNRYMMESFSGLTPRRNLFEAAYVIDSALADEDIPLEGGGRLRVREFPAVELMACVVHRGSDNDRSRAHHGLLRWMAMQGYALAGPQREIYLLRGTPGETSDEHVTEVQHPIKRIETTSIDK
ncbi:MAG: MerR family transcriptional regulator [Chloroflexota bacterium]